MNSLRRWSARHDSQKVDLAFVVDCTGSMGSYINQTQRHINYIAETISRTAFNVHLALVEYRDHPPQDSTFVTRTHDFTNSLSEMKGWVDGMSASGGGDAPEAVADGLYDALNLTYRPQATKICVWIGDAQPHGLDTNRDLDQFPDGCPANRDPVQICHEMAAKGIILYCVGCEPSLSLYREFFMGLCLITGGQYIRLHGAKLLTQVIVMLTREEVENENLMGYVDDHLHLELQDNATATVDRLANSLHRVLQLNNNRTRRMRYNNTEIEPFTNLARRVSYMHTIAEAAAEMQPRFQAGQVAPGGEDVGLLTSTDITDLDEVSPRQCERLVRRSLARNGRQARESTDAVMDLN